MRTIKFGILAVSLVVFSSCKKGNVFCTNGDGNSITQERNHVDFNAISIEMGADIFIHQGEKYNVQIEASENLQELIETEVNGTELIIDLEKNKCIRSNEKVKIYITLPDLEEVDLRGSGNIYLNNEMILDELDMSISGSGSVFAQNSLELDNLELNISGSGDLDLDKLDVNRIDIGISGSGRANLLSVDTANFQTTSISGSGGLQTAGFPVKDLELVVSGSGNCEVNAIEKLDVVVSGSGDVRYKGNPIITQQVSGSGSIKPL